MSGSAPPGASPIVPLDPEGRAYKRRIWAVAAGILAFLTVQCGWALAIGSRQLFKDGTDWIYDVVLYAIAAFVFGRGAGVERASALAIAAVLGVAGVHTLYDLWDKVTTPRPIEVLTLGFSAAGAIVISYLVIGALWRFRGNDNPLIRATWLSSRNEAISTTLFALVTLATRVAPVRWPEYVLDLVGAAINFQASFAIVRAERRDRRPAQAAEAAPAHTAS